MHWGPIELSSSLLLFGVSFLLKNSNAPAILLLLGRLDMCYVMYSMQSEDAKSLIIAHEIDLRKKREKNRNG
jgi:hypothetical protein